MKIRILITATLTFTVLFLAIATSADGVTRRIKFAKGKHASTVAGSVVRGDRDTYILGSGSGQAMTVKITSIEKNAVFQIENPDGEYLDGAGETDDATDWQGTLPDNGDYRIVVGGTRGNASYRLTVSIR